MLKWTVLGSGPKERELIRLMGLVCGGLPFVSSLQAEARRLCADRRHPLDLEFVLARHPPHDGSSKTGPLIGSGLRIGPDSQMERLTRKDCECLPLDLPVFQPAIANGNGRYFCLAYGYTPVPKRREDFDFEDPFHRVRRFHSLFRPNAEITNPVAFLTRLHYKAIRVSRFPAQQIVRQLTHLLTTRLGIDTAAWWAKTCNLAHEWRRLGDWQRRILLPILDAVRHTLDASPRMGYPLTAPGVVLMDRPDLFCPPSVFASWIELFDSLLPNMQFVLTLPPGAQRQVPDRLRRAKLRISSAQAAKEKTPRKRRLPPGSVLLVDVDGRLPNLALMKLSQYFKTRGQRVNLVRQEAYVSTAKEIWASCVFYKPASLGRVERLRSYYGDSLHVGGSGVDLARRLPPQVDALDADYRLYPELGDRAIGFLTRGCPFACPFCIVPRKEGKIRQVTDLDSLLQGRKKLILLDDNILAHPEAATFLEEMVRCDTQVNFNQTLDIRLLDDDKARLLRRIRCRDVAFKRDNYFFSLNDTRWLAEVARCYSRLGFDSRNNVEFICMYGYNTTLAEDLERFRFLRSLPGAYVFVQQYRPFPGAPRPDLHHFFGPNADRQIDELVRIVFPQNMKSMEKYYRWISQQYARQFGKLHKGLVDTIFRYNNRHAKGRYIASLAGTL